ncbi:hypothetical protein [Ferdinandcohnia sp. SAFN-114]|uniref:hypothetical protein n=1 Tax=Ferdinandcohnia sp. SAFN-114 TaxID=3387275 RepID=UPI003F80F743
MFNKEDVYIGYSMEELSKVRDILASNGIKCTYSVINSSGKMVGRGTTRGNFGSAGMNHNYEKQYVVSVKKKDFEEAKYIINKLLHP